MNLFYSQIHFFEIKIRDIKKKKIVRLIQMRGISEILKYEHTGIKEYQKQRNVNDISSLFCITNLKRSSNNNTLVKTLINWYNKRIEWKGGKQLL